MSDTDKTTAPGSDRRKPHPNGAGDPPAQQEPQAPPPEPPAEQEAKEAQAKPSEESAEIQRLRAELDAAKNRVNELARAFQSMNQEREEFKARLTRERERLLDVERGNVALTLLEAIDELDRCLSASANDESPLAKGVRLIRGALLNKLNQTGIERLEMVGKPYDPNMAEAADMELTTSPDEDQKVVAEVQAGYKLKDRIIRPGRVKVAKYVKPASA